MTVSHLFILLGKCILHFMCHYAFFTQFSVMSPYICVTIYLLLAKDIQNLTVSSLITIS